MVALKLKAGRAEINSMSSLVRSMKLAAQPQLLAYANRLGVNGVAQILAGARGIYNTGRPTSRRRHPGSLRLGSGAMFDYNAIPYRTGDAATQFLVKGGAAEKTKFGVLNFGAGSHPIDPVKGAGLAFPSGDGGKAIDTNKGASKEGVFITGWGPPPPTGVMWSPGAKIGTHFYEKGIARARRMTR